MSQAEKTKCQFVLQSELALLYWSDVDYDNRYLNITARRSEAKMRPRSIPLSDRAIQAIKERKRFKEHNTLIFVGTGGNP